MPIDWSAVENEALELLRRLIRLDTTNPPGNELPAATLLADTLRAEGIEPTVITSAPGRGNVVARLKGNGTHAPLLLTAHLDVVEAEADKWQHPPFGAEIHDGCVWGRGAVDMKHMAAMSTIVLALLKREGVQLSRDVIFAGVADEEAGSKYGSEYLVDHHLDLVKCEYALGEIGGFSLHLGPVTYYPIQIAQKGTVWGTMRTKGSPGHGSIPRPDNAVSMLARKVAAVADAKLPLHISEPVKDMLDALASHQGLPNSAVLKGLKNPLLARKLLNVFPNPAFARAFSALLMNTITPTVLKAGSKTNVIPSTAEAQFDGRTAPGQTKEDLLRELREIIGEDVEIDLLDSTPPVVTPVDTPLFHALEDAVRRADPKAIPIPYVIPGFTDARAFHRAGAKYYGFAPIKLEPGQKLSFTDLYHGHDERIPVEGFKWGLRLLFDAVKTFCAA